MVTYWAHNPKFRVRVSGPQLMGVTWVEPHEPLLHQESEGLEVAVTTLTRKLITTMITVRTSQWHIELT
jgi:hypothetical protein